ncbi:MAG: FHA domain-containing protein [Gammaproteobacteria bacterium]
MARFFKFLVDLSRSNVTRAAGAYIVTVLLLSRVISDFFPAFGLPVSMLRVLGILAILGLPLVLLVAWRFEVTPEGVVAARQKGSNQTVERQMSPTEITEWVKARHNPLGAGHIVASWTDSESVLQRKEFFKPLFIGRDEACDIRLGDERVSRAHAALWAEGGRWKVRDLGSSNGTWIDGEQVNISALPDRCKLRAHKDGPIVELTVAAAQATVIAFDRNAARGG